MNPSKPKPSIQPATCSLLTAEQYAALHRRIMQIRRRNLVGAVDRVRNGVPLTLSTWEPR